MEIVETAIEILEEACEDEVYRTKYISFILILIYQILFIT
jgi:hypothetical protein